MRISEAATGGVLCARISFNNVVILRTTASEILRKKELSRLILEIGPIRFSSKQIILKSLFSTAYYKLLKLA